MELLERENDVLRRRVELWERAVVQVGRVLGGVGGVGEDCERVSWSTADCDRS